MKLQLASALGLIAAVTVSGSAVYADSYSTITTTESAPLVERTATVQSAPAVIREEAAPVIVEPPANNTTIIKKKTHAHHLLNLGVVKVF
jgi:hypothetical protein